MQQAVKFFCYSGQAKKVGIKLPEPETIHPTCSLWECLEIKKAPRPSRVPWLQQAEENKSSDPNLFEF